MKKTCMSARIASWMLVLALLASFVLPAQAGRANAAGQAASLSFRRTEETAAPQRLLPEAEQSTSQSPDYESTDLVRVSIVLDKPSTLEAGYDIAGIASNSGAMAYRDGLKQEQASLTAQLQLVTGEQLSVVWNLTLAANLISADVPYGQLSAIAALPGVREVALENRYDPAVYEKDEKVDPNMSTSSEMIGSTAAWACGYTGAGPPDCRD